MKLSKSTVFITSESVKISLVTFIRQKRNTVIIMHKGILIAVSIDTENNTFGIWETDSTAK